MTLQIENNRNNIIRQLLLRMLLVRAALLICALRIKNSSCTLNDIHEESAERGEISTSMVGTYSYGGPGPHAVTQAGSNTYQYDANGNMTSRDGYAVVYDYDNRATTLNGANGSVQSVYDYTGQRVEKTAPIGTTVYMGKFYSCMNGAVPSTSSQV